MVRGKARAAVEFGAKISVSVRNGFAFLHRISWDQYNKAEEMISHVKEYKQEHGHYPERDCADHIHLNTKNKDFCSRFIIRQSGNRLCRPPKDQEINAAHNQQAHCSPAEAQRGGRMLFGPGKRKYSIDLTMDRLPKGAENSISMAFLAICAETRRLLSLLFVTIFACVCTSQWSGRL
jgi:IS5 family transposase